MLTRQEEKELLIILKERYINNRNLIHIETLSDCVESCFFGFKSFKNLKKAHTNNYKKYTLSLFFETISDGNEYCYYLSNIDNCIFTKDKFINFGYKELKFILEEFDFEIKNIHFKSDDDEQVNIYIELLNSNDTEEILNLQQKRLNKIKRIEEEFEKLKMLKESF